jgi:uncharacterized protein YcgI (DUF1989 family)
VAEGGGVIMISYGKERFDLVLQPISGKAVPVYAGEVLRIIQVEGEQCVDFNALTCTITKKGWTSVLAVAQLVFDQRKETS